MLLDPGLSQVGELMLTFAEKVVDLMILFVGIGSAVYPTPRAFLAVRDARGVTMLS